MLKIRRGRRTDLEGLKQLLSPLDLSDAQEAAKKEQLRYWRKIASDSSLEFYVALTDNVIGGAVLINYVHGLHSRKPIAILDIAASESIPDNLWSDLLNFAKERAKLRSCAAVTCLQLERKMMDSSSQSRLKGAGFEDLGEFWSCPL